MSEKVGGNLGLKSRFLVFVFLVLFGSFPQNARAASACSRFLVSAVVAVSTLFGAPLNGSASTGLNTPVTTRQKRTKVSFIDVLDESSMRFQVFFTADGPMFASIQVDSMSPDYEIEAPKNAVEFQRQLDAWLEGKLFETQDVIARARKNFQDGETEEALMNIYDEQRFIRMYSYMAIQSCWKIVGIDSKGHLFYSHLDISARPQLIEKFKEAQERLESAFDEFSTL
ncbi:MAG: hypothetical protein AB7F43_08375 [Bacteriovoracia bacterium]